MARPPATAASGYADPDVHYAMTDDCDEAIDLPWPQALARGHAAQGA